MDIDRLMSDQRLATRAIERSVDSLDRIYAVIIALAITQAILTTFIDPATDRLLLDRSTLLALPMLLAFLVTVVPFYHGMNRHLDRSYVERADTAPHGALLLDFIVFFFEAGLLFAFAASLRDGYRGVVFLGLALAIDTIWGVVANWIHRGPTAGPKSWAAVNFAALVVGILLFTADIWTPEVKASVFFVVALARSVADYALNWQFYFPGELAKAPAITKS
jgi:hypothetical protein